MGRSSDKGKVYLVGAGPGDPGLFTLKGAALLAECEVLIYDNLVSGEIMRMAAASCEKIYVGKSGSSHAMEQEEISRLIVQKALDGKMVVRLKGGDPFIFGRGGEEAEELYAAGIEFEIVCGISSAYSAPAYAGIPVTHRGKAASVAFITGHEDPTKDESDINWPDISRGAQTLVFLMGVKNLPLITERLIANGRPASTPAAVIMNGTYPDQKTVTGTLLTIAGDASRAGIKAPSIIVVGAVVELRGRLNWFENRPLYGKRVIVTRARTQASALSKKLIGLGAGVIEIPAIKIVPAPDRGPLLKAAANAGSYDWIIFTSANGVNYFFEALYESGGDSRSLCGSNVCAIGPATADELKKHGIMADLIPEKFISTSIVKSLNEKNEITGKKFLLPRADIAPEAIVNDLKNGGASLVHSLTAYSTARAPFETDEKLKKIITSGDFDIVTFTSSSTAENFSKFIAELGMTNSGIKCVAIGPITAMTAEKLGFSVEAVSEEHTIEGLTDTLKKYFDKIKHK